MPETFHPFGQLPWELREMIWELAIRPDRPGAHFFGIYDTRHEDNGSSNTEDSGDVALSADIFNWLRLTAPKCAPRSVDANLHDTFGEEVVASWTRHNPSAYLIDGGLWTACKESRFIMERNFKSQEWEAVRKDRRHREASIFSPNKDKMLATGYFAGKDSTDHYFTVFPHRDLFCLQPRDLKALDWGEINYDITIGSTHWGFAGLQEVALEFDPAWGIAAEKAGIEASELDIVQTIVDAVYDSHNASVSLSTIWFIDYKIKRRHYVPTEKEAAINNTNKAIFFGSDRRFVQPCISEWDLYSSSEDEIDSEDRVVSRYGAASSSEFVFLVDTAIENRLNIEINNGYESDWEEPPNIYIGLLACEYF